MDNETVVDQIVRSLSFEVVAIPQDVIQTEYPSNSTPLNVKIRVRKKGDAGLPEAVLSMSKVDREEHVPGRIRLVSSDQTVMSFNIVMENDNDTKRHNLALIQTGSKYVADIATGSGIKTDGVTKNRFTLNKKDKLESSLVLSKRNKDIFGRCKPGGCLDPPFGEEKYSYKYAKGIPSQIIKSTVGAADVSNKIKTSSIFKNTIFRRKKKSCQDEDNNKNDTCSTNITDSCLNLHQTESIQASSSYSTSIITYPHTSNSSDLHNKERRHSKIRCSSEDRSSIASYFIIPKKNKNQPEQNNTSLLNDCVSENHDQNIVGDINDTRHHNSSLLKTSLGSKTSVKTNITPLLIPLPVLATFDGTVRDQIEIKSQLTHKTVAQNLVSKNLTDNNDCKTRLELPTQVSLGLEVEVQDLVLEEKYNHMNHVLLTEELSISKPIVEVTHKKTKENYTEAESYQINGTQLKIPPTISVDDANLIDSYAQLLPSTLYENNIKENKSSIDTFVDDYSNENSNLINLVSNSMISNNGKELFHNKEEKSHFIDTTILVQPTGRNSKLASQNNESNEMLIQLSEADLHYIPKSSKMSIESKLDDIGYIPREVTQYFHEDNQPKLINTFSDYEIEDYKQEECYDNKLTDSMRHDTSRRITELEALSYMNDISKKLDASYLSVNQEKHHGNILPNAISNDASQRITESEASRNVKDNSENLDVSNLNIKQEKHLDNTVIDAISLDASQVITELEASSNVKDISENLDVSNLNVYHEKHFDNILLDVISHDASQNITESKTSSNVKDISKNLYVGNLDVKQEKHFDNTLLDTISDDASQRITESEAANNLNDISEKHIDKYLNVKEKKCHDNILPDEIIYDASQKLRESETPINVNDISNKLHDSNLNVMDDIDKLLDSPIQKLISNSSEIHEYITEAPLKTPDEITETARDNNIFNEKVQVTASNAFTEDLNIKTGTSKNESLNKSDNTNCDEINIDCYNNRNITTLSDTGENETRKYFEDTEEKSSPNFIYYEEDDNQIVIPITSESDEDKLEIKSSLEPLSNTLMSQNFDKQSIKCQEISSALDKTSLCKNILDSDILQKTSPTSILRKDTCAWKVDLALRSCSDVNGERVIKSFDSENIPQGYQTKALIIAKCSLKSDSNGIKIPIDNENQLSIQIKRNGANQSSTDISIMADDLLRKNKIQMEIPGGEVENRDYDDVNKSGANKHNIMINDNVYDALISIYEQELVPLQAVIKGLREEVDLLSSYRMMLKEKCTLKRIKTPRLVHSNRKCGCSRRS